MSVTLPKSAGIFASNARYRTDLLPMAGTQVIVGSSKSRPDRNASRRNTGSGVVLNSSPRARALCFHGGAAIPMFSSQIATQGKSLRLKQYAISKPSFALTAATNPTLFFLSRRTATTNPKPCRRKGRLKSTFPPSSRGALGQLNSSFEVSKARPSSYP